MRMYRTLYLTILRHLAAAGRQEKTKTAHSTILNSNIENSCETENARKLASDHTLINPLKPVNRKNPGVDAFNHVESGNIYRSMGQVVQCPA